MAVLLLQIADEPDRLQGSEVVQQLTPVAVGLLAVLGVMLLASLFVGSLKVIHVARIQREQRRFRRRLGAATTAEELATASGEGEPGARVLRAMIQRVDRGPVGPEELGGVALQAITEEERQASNLLPILTGVASTGPLMGLLGTVWGIIEAFLALDQSRSSAINVVAPAMAGALLTTALGLLAAIPALLCLQFAERRTNDLVAELEAAAQTWVGVLLGR
ncbi:MAG: MotA/TolQ/ExbB proton channel family protein [Polyangiaceae bacterium]